MESRIQDCHGFPYMGRTDKNVSHYKPPLARIEMNLIFFDVLNVNFNKGKYKTYLTSTGVVCFDALFLFRS